MNQDKKILLMDIGLIILVFTLIFCIPMFIGTFTSYKKNNEMKIKESRENINKGNFTFEKVKVFINSENNIKELDIEDYVVGVVASEMPVSFEKEALVAQGILARTFVISKKINKCNNANGADICDTVHCQVYTEKNKKKQSWGKNGDEYLKKITEAVEKSKGMVLSYNNELVRYPQYFAVSSGKTEDSKYVFSQDIPYLKSVYSPGEESAPKFNSKEEYTKDEFIKKIKEYNSEIKLNKKDLDKEVKILNRNPGDTVNDIKLGNKNIKGIEFRKIFKLNSANFTIRIDKDKIYIDCIGYGHGVGMSQWGANAMAKEGKSYIDILKHYFSKCDISSVKDINIE